MKSLIPLLIASCLTPTLLLAADVSATNDVVDLKNLDAASLKTDGGAQASVAQEAGAPVLKITFPAAKGYPGVDIPGPWDLSSFSGVSADITNNGSGKLGVSLRVDNAGDWQKSPWNTESIWLAAGASGTVTVNFGRSFGNPGYDLNPSAVARIKIFVSSPQTDGEIIVQNIKAVAK